MPSSIERPPAANVVAHATEYPPDRERQGREEEARKESYSQRQDEHSDLPISDDPEAVIISHVEEDHRLDGVSAYRALAAHQAVKSASDGSAKPLRVSFAEGHTPDEVRHAYEDHPEPENELHKINLAT